MARKWLTPKSACVVTTSGSVDGSEGAYAWLGLAADEADGACAAFYNSGSLTAGRQLWNLSVAASGATRMVGPFVAASGIYVRLNGTGACAIVAMDKEPA